MTERKCSLKCFNLLLQLQQNLPLSDKRGFSAEEVAMVMFCPDLPVNVITSDTNVIGRDANFLHFP